MPFSCRRDKSRYILLLLLMTLAVADEPDPDSHAIRTETLHLAVKPPSPAQQMCWCAHAAFERTVALPLTAVLVKPPSGLCVSCVQGCPRWAI